MVITDISPCL